MAKMSASHFLFLGYGMRDWNLRVILHHIWSQQTRTFASWAIQKHLDPVDEKFWERQHVELIGVPLEDWVEGHGRKLAVTAPDSGARFSVARTLARGRRRTRASNRIPKRTPRTSSGEARGASSSPTTFSATASRSSTARAASGRARSHRLASTSCAGRQCSIPSCPACPSSCPSSCPSGAAIRSPRSPRPSSPAPLRSRPSSCTSRRGARWPRF